MQVQKIQMHSSRNTNYSNKKDPTFGMTTNDLKILAEDPKFVELFPQIKPISNAFESLEKGMYEKVKTNKALFNIIDSIKKFIKYPETFTYKLLEETEIPKEIAEEAKKHSINGLPVFSYMQINSEWFNSKTQYRLVLSKILKEKFPTQIKDPDVIVLSRKK